ncbi:MAG: type IIL restriction-modification enzyme MmeI, partial [Pirellula sp.]
MFWPGTAAVVVGVVHVSKGVINCKPILDGREVSLVTAYLFHTGPDEDASKLTANENRCFVGNVVLGVGFTFDDSDTSGQANTISDMKALIAKDSRNAEVIFPYINGQEVNSSVSPDPKRYVINFGDMSIDDVKKWPDLLEIAERKVKPLRYGGQSTVNPERWWMFARPATELYTTIGGLRRVLVRSLTSTNFSTFTFLPNGIVYDQTLIVFAFETEDALAILASRVHESWGLFQGGSMKDDPRYNVDDCFKTFPFPSLELVGGILKNLGESYYEHRSITQKNMGDGLTKTYNRFHDPNEKSSEILHLRELHEAMDRAVLEAYGWDDLAATARCEFL